MEKNKWQQFLRMVMGITLTAIGIALFGGSEGELVLIVSGSLLAGIGLALLLIQ